MYSAAGWRQVCDHAHLVLAEVRKFPPWRVRCLKQTDLQISKKNSTDAASCCCLHSSSAIFQHLSLSRPASVGKHTHTGRNTFCTPSSTQFRIYHSCTFILHRATPSSDSLDHPHMRQSCWHMSWLSLASAFARSKKPMPKRLILSRFQEIPGDQPGSMIEAAAHCADSLD